MHGCGCVSFPFNETNEIKYKVRSSWVGTVGTVGGVEHERSEIEISLKEQAAYVLLSLGKVK